VGIKGEQTSTRKEANVITQQSPFHFIVICLALFVFATPQVLAGSAPEQKALVTKARITFEGFIADPDLSWFRDNVKKAKGILIYPQIIKGAFFIGGSGGSGVLLVRDEKTRKWSQPAFYTIGSGSFGLQFGGQALETVLMIMTPKGIKALYSSSFNLGGDMAVAAGPVGVRAEGSTPMNFSADFISFARSKGAFIGFSLEGAVIATREKWNEAYYGKLVSPAEIIVKGSVNNSQSAKLRAAVAKGTK
jgi:lipid-binding SYLF domain-containing protein